MTGTRATILLSLTLALASLGVIYGYARLSSSRDAADRAAEDLVRSRAILARLGTSDGATASVSAADLSRVVRESAERADAAGRQVSFEAGTLSPGDDGWDEQTAFVRFEDVSLRQIVGIAVGAGEKSPLIRVREIEMTPGEGADVWSADMTVGCFVRKGKGS